MDHESAECRGSETFHSGQTVALVQSELMWLFVCQVHPEWRVRLTASWSFATLISFIQIWLAFSRNCLPKINACDLFHEVTQASSNSPDLNRCTLKDMRRDFHQFITCPTRHNETLDLCYVKVKGTYKIHLPSRIWVPVTIIACVLYRTVLKQGKVQSENLGWGCLSESAGLPWGYRLGHV